MNGLLRWTRLYEYGVAAGGDHELGGRLVSNGAEGAVVPVAPRFDFLQEALYQRLSEVWITNFVGDRYFVDDGFEDGYLSLYGDVANVLDWYLPYLLLSFPSLSLLVRGHPVSVVKTGILAFVAGWPKSCESPHQA
jgi:hypothetical protein